MRPKIQDSLVSGMSILVMVALAVGSLLLQNRAEEWVLHTHGVKRQIMEVYGQLQEAEGNLRGCLLTNDTSYLRPFGEPVKRLVELELLDLRGKVADNPSQKGRLLRFEVHAKAKLYFMQRTYDTFRSGKVAQAIGNLRSGVGERLMVKLAKIKDEMLAEEDRLLLVRQQRNLHAQRASLLLLALAFVLAAFSLVRLYRRIGPLITSLDRLNADLSATLREKEREIELRKRLEQRNSVLVKSLTAKNADLNHFAYIASHDLQEPLRTVDNFIEVFKEDYGDKLGDEAHTYFGFIQGATQRMKELIQGLLNFSRLGKSKEPEEVNLQALLADVKGNLAATMLEKGATVEATGPLPTLLCMRTEATQLFQNLVSNALKYVAPGTTPVVAISATDRGDEWEFCVADNGIGIAEMHQEKIFNMFSRLHGDGEYGGRGIGLAFCKKIVELHGGNIWVRSAPGEGSSFYFTIAKNG